ncbi:MAG: nucleoside 2-deoxyribosyltransferase [Erysipelotrichaceae bacterium]|nr:nucleoside 2-deoxyribosyltransferase [Erysipelotrichaceae bacterium]
MFIDKQGKLRKPVAYLADFEMFLPSCPQTVRYWKSVCDKYGIIGLFPGEGDPIQPGDDYWQRVFDHDYDWMKYCDMCIAQLDDWRGHECDSGTLFELGYFVALGMPSYGFYTGNKPMLERKIEKRLDEGVWYDADGFMIEDRGSAFDNILSLVKIADSFEEACRWARADFDRQLIEAGYEPYKTEGK